MKKVFVLLLSVALATPALAWGEREQGALAGIAATLIFQHIQRGHQPQVVQQPQVVVQQPPVVVQQQIIVPPTIQLKCVPTPNHDYQGRVIGYAYVCQ